MVYNSTSFRGKPSEQEMNGPAWMCKGVRNEVQSEELQAQMCTSCF